MTDAEGEGENIEGTLCGSDEAGEFASENRACGVKRKVPESAEVSAEDSDSVAEGCPICFEPWTSGGLHRVCSLNCGHLFGKYCIETWLSHGARAKCPQCNLPALKKDIRVLFVKNLSVVDTFERDTLAQQLEQERLARKKLQEHQAKLQLAYNVALAEINTLKEEISDLRKSSDPVMARTDFGMSSIRFSWTASFGAGSAGRCMDFDSHSKLMAVGISKPGVAGRLHGIAKASLLDATVQFVPLHTQLIRSLCFSPFCDGLLLSTAFDKTLKLSSLSSNGVLLSYQLDAPGWSCAFDQDRNNLHVGLGNGTICTFDVRNTRDPLRSVSIPTKIGSFLPIHSLYQYSENQCNKFACATTQGPLVVEIDANETATFTHPEISSDFQYGPLAIDPQSLSWAISMRSSPGRHLYGRVKNSLWSLHSEIGCSFAQASLVKSSLLVRESQVLLASPDSCFARLSLMDWRGEEINSCSIKTNPSISVLEAKLGLVDGRTVLGLLSERQLDVFR